VLEYGLSFDLQLEIINIFDLFTKGLDKRTPNLTIQC